MPNTVRAPYNFIPFSNFIIKAYENAEDLPHHDGVDPNLCSGEISVKITAKSPILVKNGGGRDFYTNANGVPTIPGSTFRGLIRENMQILSFGAVKAGEDFQDRSVYYRNFSAANGTVYTRAVGHYNEILGNHTPRDENGRTVRIIAKNVLGGYLHYDSQSKSYYIRPAMNLDERGYGIVKATEIHRTNDYFVDEVCWYRGSGDSIDVSNTERDGYKKGRLFRPGRMGTQNSFYVFPQEDTNADIIWLDKDDVNYFRIDYDLRKAAWGRNAVDKINFFALPNEERTPRAVKPVFYLMEGKHCRFGFSRMIRLSYLHPVKAGLPDAHKHVQEELVLDYPRAVMGYVNKDFAYKSRVSVGDLCLSSINGVTLPFRLTPGTPKPSFFAGYLQDGKDYNADDFLMNGYKQYWLQNSENPLQDNNGTGQTTELKPLKAGVVFFGTIRYKNLRPDELGLLLWSIALEDGCYQNIGTGKAYGLGVIQVNIEKLVEYPNPVGLYDSFAFKLPKPSSMERIKQLIDGFKTKTLNWIHEHTESSTFHDLAEINEIADFFYMKKTLISRVGAPYPRLNDFKNFTEPLKMVRSFRSGAANVGEILPSTVAPQVVRTTLPAATVSTVYEGIVTKLLYDRESHAVFAVLLNIGCDYEAKLFTRDVTIRVGSRINVRVNGQLRTNGPYSNYPVVRA